jgi:STE24 endopeptidase
MNEFWKSCLYLLACASIYLALNVPNLAFRSIALKENVLADIAAHWRLTWRLYEVARGNAMPTVLLLITGSVLFYEALGIKFNQWYVPVFMVAQFVFGITYPIVTQPRKKHLSLMEPEAMNDSIHDLASNVKLNLKNIYISDGPEPKDIEDGVQTFGWPRMRYIAIHRAVIEQCTSEDIKALIAQQLGCWKYSNNIRAFYTSHVRPSPEHCKNC